MFECLADESGYTEVNLEPSSELVTLAVEAGLPIPGPMAPDTVPPAPPVWGGSLCAPTYRDDEDKLRCVGCGKVVYGTHGAGHRAAKEISSRQPMRAYLGPCGHYHISRDKQRHGQDVYEGLVHKHRSEDEA